MERKERGADITELVDGFMKYKGIEFSRITAVIVKHSNIVVKYDEEKRKNRVIEFNLAFLFSYCYHSGLEAAKAIRNDEILKPTGGSFTKADMEKEFSELSDGIINRHEAIYRELRKEIDGLKPKHNFNAGPDMSGNAII